eukprot:2198149-Rhodomonas_salina.1
MTKIFRDYTDGLDLVAANDECDAAAGSDMLKNADIEVVGAGTEFVDSAGVEFASAIRITPEGVDSDGEVHSATITIPDAELYKISRTLNPAGNLTDSRELFIGLLDMLPTGTRVVDSSSQQISVVLTRTQYGSFAAYGAQNIDYDFISFLNARAHKVISQTEAEDRRAGLIPDQFYAEVSFVYDDRLQPLNASGAVEMHTVTVRIGDDVEQPCGTPDSPAQLDGAFEDVVVDQTCGPQALKWTSEVCPQVSTPDDHFGRLYIPLPADLDAGVIHIEFDLWFVDLDDKSDRMQLAMDLAVSEFVTWCAAGSGSVDLAERVIPSIIVGTEANSPPRLEGWEAMSDGKEFSTGAETLQDGLVTLILELNETNGLDDNLEVFFEDVVVVHVNPGSQPDATQITNAVTGQNAKYLPTYTYDPDTRDGQLNIPPALAEECPAEDATGSFFGCVHKHILRNKAVTNASDAYLVGSSLPPAAGAQDFVEAMLGDGTASVAARELGRDFEAFLGAQGVTGSSRKKVGLWINPGMICAAMYGCATTSYGGATSIYGCTAAVRCRCLAH